MVLVYSLKSLGKSDFFTTMNLIFGLYLWSFREVNFQKVTLYGYLSISLFVIFLSSKLILGIFQNARIFYSIFEFFHHY